MATIAAVTIEEIKKKQKYQLQSSKLKDKNSSKIGRALGSDISIIFILTFRKLLWKGSGFTIRGLIPTKH